MERPLYGKDTENTSLEAGDAGRIDNRAAHLKLAGHISLQKENHSGEVNLRQETPRTVHVPGVAQMPGNGPAFQPVQFSQAPKPSATPESTIPADLSQADHIERSAWHSIALDNQGQVMETTHGAAFKQETQPEQMVVGTASPMQSDDHGQSQQVPQTPFQASVTQQPFSQPVPPQQPVASQPQFTQPVPPHMPQQGYAQAPVAPQVQQQAHYYQPGQQQPAQQYQQPTATPPLAGAVNPSFPVMPTQPTLPTGQPTHADPQHLLGRSKKSLLKSPWIWLAIGLAMIIYFGASLF